MSEACKWWAAEVFVIFLDNYLLSDVMQDVSLKMFFGVINLFAIYAASPLLIVSLLLVLCLFLFPRTLN